MWYHYILIFLTVFLLFVNILSCYVLSIKNKQKVCVIGAGPSGLTSTKQLAEYPDEFEIVVFEKNSDIGGIWIYNERTDIDEHGLPLFSPIYKYLRTNNPKEVLAFPDYRRWNGNQSFVTHPEVLSYLRNFTDCFNLRQYVKFNTLVEKVTTLPDSKVWTSTKYEIKTRNLNTNKCKKTICDAIIIANGWNTKPNIPKIPGIENFSGIIIHSVEYRVPEEFAGKTVVVLGASSSGTDISIEVSSYAKKIYLSHRHPKIESPLPPNIKQVAGVVAADGEIFTLQDGSQITADVFIFCTGYEFSAPFLDETSGVTVYKNYIYPVYKHVVNVEHPTMAFIGLPQNTIAFLSFHFEAKYFIESLRGVVVLPDRETMMTESEIIDKNRPYAQVEMERQFKYYDELAQAANATPLPNYYRPFNWFAFGLSHLTTFRDYNLIILNENSTQLFHRNERLADDLHF